MPADWCRTAYCRTECRPPARSSAPAWRASPAAARRGCSIGSATAACWWPRARAGGSSCSAGAAIRRSRRRWARRPCNCAPRPRNPSTTTGSPRSRAARKRRAGTTPRCGSMRSTAERRSCWWKAAAHPGAPVWAHDGRRLAFSATLRAGETSDLYMLDTGASAGPRLIASGDAGAWQVLAWTSADRSLLVRHTVSGRGDELLLVDVDTGAMRRVDAQPAATAGYAHIGEARLAPDDRGIYLITNRGSDHDQLQYIDLYANSAIELPADFGHGVGHFDVSPDGHLVALSWNDSGYDRIALLDRQTSQLRTLANLPPGNVSALRFDHAGTHLAIELVAATAPRDVYVYDLASAGLRALDQQPPRRFQRRAAGCAADRALPDLGSGQWQRPHAQRVALPAAQRRPAPGADHARRRRQSAARAARPVRAVLRRRAGRDGGAGCDPRRRTRDPRPRRAARLAGRAARHAPRPDCAAGPRRGRHGRAREPRPVWRPAARGDQHRRHGHGGPGHADPPSGAAGARPGSTRRSMRAPRNSCCGGCAERRSTAGLSPHATGATRWRRRRNRRSRGA